jgi:uracil-DNA glycosylase
MTASLDELLSSIRACRICEQHLPLGPRPVVQAGATARILIASQAPGRKVHETGRPFTDASGERLRDWLAMSEDVFYDKTRVAIAPMGFCYPGTGKGGDLPPRPECAPRWRRPLLELLPNIQLTLAIGKYAIAYHLPEVKGNLTETVRRWREFWPAVMPLPHPSPRNNLWLKRNPWFEAELLPELKKRVKEVLEH